MTSLFAPPELLSAYAFAEDGSDPDLVPGTHLRLFAGLGPSFPLAPFAVFKLASRESEPRSVYVTDREGRRVDNFDLSQIGVGEATLVLGDSDTRRTVRVELDDPDRRVDGAVLLSQKSKQVAMRDKPRWLFSAPVMHRLLAWGSASQLRIRTRSVDIEDILEGGNELAGILGFPVEGPHRWYTGGQSRTDGLQRAKRGAPQRLNPMDRPDGPFDSVSPSEEVMRVEAILASGQLGGGLENLLSTLVEDADPPWVQIEKQEMLAPDGKKQFVRAPRLGTLQMAVIDPGLARFFGFADQMDDFPDLDNGGGWDTLAIVGLFAIAPNEFDRRGLNLTPLLHEPAQDASRLLELLVRTLEETSGHDMRPEIDDVMSFVRDMGFVAAPFVAVVSPVPPWLPPSLPQPQILQHRWQAATGGTPSSLYRASFAFLHPPLASMASLAARLEGSWVSRHDTVEIAGGQPPARAKPRIFGHEQESGSRLRKHLQAPAVFEPAGLLSDQDIPDAAGQVAYRVQAPDFFGRFGSPVEFTIAAPPRPAPPPPVLRYHLERAAIDLASSDRLSPGVLRLTVAVPHPEPADRFTEGETKRLGPAIVAPRIDDLAAGSLPVATLTLSLPGQPPEVVDLSVPGFFDVELSLPDLGPQEKQTWTLTGVFTDTAGAGSGPATLPVEVTDVRPPHVYPAGIGLFWTSAPGPSPEVEIKLTWPAPAGSLHRVYLTDQQGLGLTPQDVAEAQPGAAPSRGRIAAVGCRKVLDHSHVDRKAFRLLTEKSIAAGPNGAVLETRLPRSMATVQFLRVVPLGPDGAEPSFDNCGIVPVAVPDSRRHAAPRIEGEVDPATGVARLRIVTDGFDRVALERDEPGLFTAGAEGNEPPQFRVRRVVGAVADPIYARPLGDGPLQVEDAAASPAVFTGTYTDDNAGRGLEPFVRYVYWAEVRLPPERRVPAGFALLDPPGGVTVLDPANAQSHPRPVSLPSAPRVLMHVPPDAPAKPAEQAITITRAPANAAGEVELTVEVADPPRAHARAIGPYRLAVWHQWEGKAIEPITNANGAALQGTWPDISGGTISMSVKAPDGVDPGGALTLRVGFADPTGRLGELTTVNV